MRVLHVVPSMDRGSTAETALDHVRHAGRGVESWVVAFEKGGAALERAASAGARTMVLDPGRGPALARDGWRVAQLARLLERERVAVVHGHGGRAGAWAAAAGLWARTPAVVRTESRFGRPGTWTTGLLESAALRGTRWIACTCDAVRRVHAVRRPWAGDRFVTVMPGVPATLPRARAAVRAELELGDSDAVVLLALEGSLPASADVMLESFFRIAQRLDGARLVLAGEPSVREPLERRAPDLGLAERTRSVAPGEGFAFADLVEAADVVAVPSSREGVPRALLESMRGGVAVIAPRAGGVPEVVNDGETGWLVPLVDAAITAEAMLHVLSDRPRARAFGAAARDQWSRRFGSERMVADMEQLYRSAVAESRRRAVTQAEEAAPWSTAKGIGS